MFTARRPASRTTAKASGKDLVQRLLFGRRTLVSVLDTFEGLRQSAPGTPPSSRAAASSESCCVCGFKRIDGLNTGQQALHHALVVGPKYLR